MERNYENAVKILESRRRKVRPKATEFTTGSLTESTTSNGISKLRGTPSLVGMSEWLEIIGYSSEDLKSLNVIHVAGTKGKGSTCAFTESFLRAHGRRTGFPRKTGLYTSPHLVAPEERIRIDSVPLEPGLFAKYFFEMYDRLPQLALPFDISKPVVERGPRFLQLFALFAFHVFIREQVDVTIFETHNGGEYDATNVIRNPVVTTVTTLGMDHVEMLGPTIERIAWHKAGIYKSGAVALSTTQDLMPSRVLKERARDKGEQLTFIDEDRRLSMETIHLAPAVQVKNASLAAAAAEAFLERKAPSDAHQLSDEDLCTGVKQWFWPGRFQIIRDDGRSIWFLDSAHNEMSVRIAAQWFAESAGNLERPVTRVLIFSHMSEQRDAVALLDSLANALKDCGLAISHVIFTTYDESEAKKESGTPTHPGPFHQTWRKVFPCSTIWDQPAIQGAIELARTLSREHPNGSMPTLITGSQHLVGPALRILQPKGHV